VRIALAIARFELRRRLRLLSTWIYFAVFLTLSILWTLASGGAFESVKVSIASERVWINAPFALMVAVSYLSALALPVISAVMGRAVQQDFEAGAHDAFFTAPINKWQYLSGRFAGAVVSLLVILSAIGLGSAAGVHFPMVDAERVGEVGAAAYLWPYVTVALPNLAIMGAVFFSLGALTRRMLPVYVVSAIMLVGYILATQITGDVENRWIAAMLDPFAIRAVFHQTEYWPVAERNTLLVPLSGYLLYNRALWLGLALAALALTFRRFRFAHAEPARGRKLKPEPDAEPAPTAAHELAWRRARPAPRSWPSLLAALTWLNFRETIKNVYFGVIVLTGLLFVFASSTELDSLYGTDTYPATYKVLELVGGQFSIFVLILVTFYSGEMIWRERDNRVDQIYDALPVPTWVPMLAKLLALMVIPVVVQIVVMLAGMALQVVMGYANLEPGLYLHHLFGIQLLHYWLLCAVAFAVQVLVNQKYLGHFAMVAYFIAITLAPTFGFEHRLYRLFQIGMPSYSEMNGWGHYLARIRWLELYWGFGAVVIVLLARLFWQRGTRAGRRARLATARARLRAPVAIAGLAALVGMAGTGAFIYYNTNVLNRFLPAHEQRAQRALYEKRYRGALLDRPHAKITAVRVGVDLYPGEQRVRGAGTYVLTNKGRVPVDQVWVNLPEVGQSGFTRLGSGAALARLEFDRRAELIADDRELGVRGYRLIEPLAPGASCKMSFEVEQAARGFRNEAPYTHVVGNGSFVNNFQFLPSLGYLEYVELEASSDRRKHGLEPRDRMRDRKDPRGLRRNYITAESDWIEFEAVVSTEPDQIAIAPGYLKDEWRHRGRRYFHYVMDSPILGIYGFLSGRYAVARDRWNDVAIEIYYHPGHEWNLDKMIAATKDSLDYFTAAFGPYQHRQFRIIEFPRYERFAMSLPNTIPFSEAIGFVARVDEEDEEDIDYPYYVTAHEMAHQWWAHQVIGGNVQGATVLSETLSQYSALMVMKRRFGDAHMKRFLRYELDRYLLGRGIESERELPLARVENQAYVHYAKGSLAMYALQDYFGEERVNRAIREYRDAVAYKGPPYTTTLDFLPYLRKAAPPGLEHLVDDLFERIIVFENRAISAEASRAEGGRHRVVLRVSAKKMSADDQGAETEVRLDQPIEIGVLDEHDRPLHREKRRLKAGENRIELVVDGVPARAGIDPLNKLIDRTPSDNLTSVSFAEP
jgi:ABC-2 type transport system permease protein